MSGGSHPGLVTVAAAASGASTWFVPIAVALITAAGLIVAGVLAPIVADKFRKKTPDVVDELLDALARAKAAEVENKKLKAQLVRACRERD